MDLLITDTAGQEQFRSFTSSYFRDKDGFLVVYDVTNRESFQNVAHWVKEIRAWDEGSHICLTGNKIDADEERQISTQEGEELAAQLGQQVSFVECSAKLNINCAKAFEQIARQCHGSSSSSSSSSGSTPTSDSIKLDGSAAEQTEHRNFACPCS